MADIADRSDAAFYYDVMIECQKLRSGIMDGTAFRKIEKYKDTKAELYHEFFEMAVKGLLEVEWWALQGIEHTTDDMENKAIVNESKFMNALRKYGNCTAQEIESMYDTIHCADCNEQEKEFIKGLGLHRCEMCEELSIAKRYREEMEGEIE